MRRTILRITLVVVTAFQVALALIFTFASGPFVAAVGLDPVPAWVPWMFAMFGARALGFAYGLVLAFRDPVRHRSWIVAMIGVQAIDWVTTLAFIATGLLTVAQASTALFLPPLFVVGLLIGFPRGGAFDVAPVAPRPEHAAA
jgi:hypothetical protein